MCSAAMAGSSRTSPQQLAPGNRPAVPSAYARLLLVAYCTNQATGARIPRIPPRDCVHIGLGSVNGTMVGSRVTLTILAC